MEEIEGSSLLALLASPDNQVLDLFGASGYANDQFIGADLFADMDGIAEVGVASAMDGYGGLGSRGSGGGGLATSGGGGGAADVGGMGGLAIHRASTYKAPSASLKPGGQDELAGHVSERMSRVEHCYTQARAQAPDLKGTLTIRLTADAEGAITVDGVGGPDEGGLTLCVTGAMRGRLAEPPDEPVSGTFTVILDPGSA